MTLEFHAVTCPFCYGEGWLFSAHSGKVSRGPCDHCDGTGSITIRSQEPRGVSIVKAWIWFSIIVVGTTLLLIYLTKP